MPTLNLGGSKSSGTDLTDLRSPKPVISSNLARLLTPSEIESLRNDKQQASQQIKALLKSGAYRRPSTA